MKVFIPDYIFREDNHAACGTIRRMKTPLTLTLSQRERGFSG
jgi:hypothetical protein